MLYCSSCSWAIDPFIFNFSFSLCLVFIHKKALGYCVKVTKKEVKGYGQLRWLKELALSCNMVMESLFWTSDFWIDEKLIAWWLINQNQVLWFTLDNCACFQLCQWGMVSRFYALSCILSSIFTFMILVWIWCVDEALPVVWPIVQSY